ncbi:possible minor structural protein gp89 [Secundilactobacillus oryzae JCM 18671]|uniref:Possible minor structural protein gp89 n=2 Tax=Secundilactobacillus oryzae TaxID=1202668 RepID=A0A081BI36_9LACO|nr:possible minor structural protein gp89 [Secundilactobacillus oryzae JCM 18671]
MIAGFNKTIKSTQKKITKLKKKVDPKGKSSSVIKALTKKQNDAKKAKDKAASAKKRADEEEHKVTILNSVKDDDRFEKDAYVMPNYPRADDSYVFMFVTDESEPHSTNVATQAVEHGMNMVTTTQMNAPTISVTAVLGGETIDDMDQIKKDLVKLRRWTDHGTDIRWNSEAGYQEHVIMSDLTSDFNRASGGTGINTCNITFTLTIATYFDSNVKKKAKKTKKTGSKPKSKGTGKGKSNSKHKYIVAKSGYTYWYVSQKTGVKLSTVEKLNKYPARKIPIGAKIYYS